MQLPANKIEAGRRPKTQSRTSRASCWRSKSQPAGLPSAKKATHWLD